MDKKMEGGPMDKDTCWERAVQIILNPSNKQAFVLIDMRTQGKEIRNFCITDRSERVRVRL